MAHLSKAFPHLMLMRLTKMTRSFSQVINLGSDDAFAETVGQDGKKIFYFTATWCPPCKQIAPVFDKLSDEYPNVKFLKVDVDQLPMAASSNKIQGIPTFQFVNGESVQEVFTGADPTQLRNKTAFLDGIE